MALDPDTIAAIHARARELADAAPPLTAEQSFLLLSLFNRCSLDNTAVVRGAS
jgi:hypothetical protein